MQFVPVKLLEPNESKELTLDLLKDTNVVEAAKKKERGKIVLELTFVPFRADSSKYGGYLGGEDERVSDDDDDDQGAGLLSVLIQEAEMIEGKRHNNPYVKVFFRGEKKRTRVNFHLQYNY